MKSISTGFKTLCFSAVLLGSILPGALAQTKKPAAAVTYKAHCGMIYSAADAKKNHYICPMDHKPLMKMTAAPKPKKGAKGGMSGMKM
jgi:hypothetical protein